MLKYSLQANHNYKNVERKIFCVILSVFVAVNKAQYIHFPTEIYGAIQPLEISQYTIHDVFW